jgi:ribonuclease G
MPRGVGCICRTASIGLEADALQRDIDLLLEKWTLAQQRIKDKRAPVWVYQEPGLVERTVRDLLAEGIDEIVIDSKHMYDMILQYVRRLDPKTQTKVKLYTDPTPIFDHYRISDQIADIFCRKVPLASGAELCLDETEALIAIDINSGKSRGGKDHPETILNTNLEAAEEVARQLRLRNVGGLVVIDFIDMRSRKDRSEVYKQFKKALSRDRAKTKVVPISALGLMEMTRQREHASLQDANYEKCDYCNGRGLVKSSTTVSVEIQRRLREVMQRYEGKVPIRIIVHPDVLARLRDQDADILEQMEADFGGELSFRADDSVHQEDFKILNQQTGKEV